MHNIKHLTLPDKKIFLIKYCFIFFISSLHAQSTAWPCAESQGILNTMGLIYHSSNKFIEIEEAECFKATPFLEKILTCQIEHLHSKDGHFIAFIAIFPIYTQEDSALYTKLFPQYPQPSPDCSHISMIKTHLKYSLNKDVSNVWKKYVQYLPKSITCKKFNADSVITYPIFLPDNKAYYQEKYNHCKVIILQKNGRGNLPIYCLYDNEGKKKLKTYLKAIENSFSYSE